MSQKEKKLVLQYCNIIYFHRKRKKHIINEYSKQYINIICLQSQSRGRIKK